MTSVVVSSNQSQQQSSLGPQGRYVPLQDMSAAPYPGPGYTPAPVNLSSNQSSNTNVVVANQPQPAPVHVTVPVDKPNPATFIVTIILMSVCMFIGMVHLALCFVPAVIFSVMGFNYGHSKSAELQRQSRVYTKVAIGLNITAMVFFVVSLVITAILTGIALGCPQLLSPYYSRYYGSTSCYGYY